MNRAGNNRRTPYAVAAAVSLATVLVFLPALKSDFVSWDDHSYVQENLHIRSLGTPFLKWAFTNFDERTWHPLTWVSHALDYAIWGLDPFGHHLTSVLLHALNTFLFVILLAGLLNVGRELRAGPDQASRFGGKAPLLTAAAAGLLFGLHPIHVEPAVWISGRKDLVCALFSLSALIAYTRYARGAPDLTVRRGPFEPLRDRRYLLAACFLALALLGKAMATTLPCVFLLLDWYPFERIGSLKTLARGAAEKLPLIGLSLAAGVLAVLANASTSGAPSVPLSTRLTVALSSLMLYLRNIVFPVDLLPYYPYPVDVSLFSGKDLVAAGAAAAITAACFLTAKKRPLWLAVWGFFIITLLPVIGIVQISEHSMADRYAYLPGAGIFLLIGLAVAWIWGKAGTLARRNAFTRTGTGVLAVLLLLALSRATQGQIGIWRDSITLWSYVIDQEADSVPAAYLNRAWEYRKTGQLERAIDDYSKAAALVPDSPVAYTNRGITYQAMGRYDLAMADYNAALGLDPFDADTYLNRGLAFKETGRPEQAISDFDAVVGLDPAYADAYLYRAMAFADRGRSGRALEDYARAISLSPSSPKAYLLRGKYHRRSDAAGPAENDFRTACELGSAEGCAALNEYKAGR